MKPEKTQKANPHKLTTRQHIIPSKCIERFAGNFGFVEVFYKPISKQLSKKPNDQIFCAKRMWDQRAESGFMKEIEDRFQKVASKIISNKTPVLNDNENICITEYLALWRKRFYYNHNPIDDQELIGIHPGEPFSKDEEEQIEKSGVIYSKVVDDKVFIPGRIMNSDIIQTSIYNEVRRNAKLTWGAVISSEGNFLLPDNFADYAIIPVSPSIVLIGNQENITIGIEEVKKINGFAISSFTDYYIGRDLAKCPT